MKLKLIIVIGGLSLAAIGGVFYFKTWYGLDSQRTADIAQAFRARSDSGPKQ